LPAIHYKITWRVEKAKKEKENFFVWSSRYNFYIINFFRISFFKKQSIITYHSSNITFIYLIFFLFCSKSIIFILNHMSNKFCTFYYCFSDGFQKSISINKNNKMLLLPNMGFELMQIFGRISSYTLGTYSIITQTIMGMLVIPYT